jgi:hypothetical protein
VIKLGIVGSERLRFVPKSGPQRVVELGRLEGKIGAEIVDCKSLNDGQRRKGAPLDGYLQIRLSFGQPHA